MTNIISICEYDKLHIRPYRDLSRNIISNLDAAKLQNIIIDKTPIFSFGNRCLIAQQYVGIIELPEFSIEILPKIASGIDNHELRSILIRMLMVANQINSIKQFKASISVRKNSFIEMIILSFLREIKAYIDSGLQHDYIKVSKNISKIKGRILFNQQITKNILTPTKFYCRYSKYAIDNDLNQFFKLCLQKMYNFSSDDNNKKLAKDFLTYFHSITDINVDVALSCKITFNSINIRAQDPYNYGRLFLENLHATMSLGSTQIHTMLFNMPQLYETFIYRVFSLVFGSKVTYQQRGNYMVSRLSDQKKFVSLRPDLTLKINNTEKWIIDTKWKLPQHFAKESDVYQMNAYSSAIKNTSKVILLYPQINSSNQWLGSYKFLSPSDNERLLEIKTIDLTKCLSWNKFIKSIQLNFTP